MSVYVEGKYAVDKIEENIFFYYVYGHYNVSRQKKKGILRYVSGEKISSYPYTYSKMLYLNS